jgi:hypothetical protein
MLLFSELIFEEIVLPGVGYYSDPMQLIGSVDKLILALHPSALDVLLGATFYLQLETSFDGVHWTNVSGSPEFSAEVVHTGVGGPDLKTLEVNLDSLGQFIRFKLSGDTQYFTCQVYAIGRGKSEDCECGGTCGSC